jgi:hypothetical protein
MSNINENSNTNVTFSENVNTEKHQRFINLAAKRTGNVLHGMDVLQKCFDKYTYDYSEVETSKITAAIEEKLAELRSAAERGSSRTNFTL